MVPEETLTRQRLCAVLPDSQGHGATPSATRKQVSYVEDSLGQDACLSLVRGHEEPCLKGVQAVVEAFERGNSRGFGSESTLVRARPLPVGSESYKYCNPV
jgi:hypothetical protein